MSVSSTDQIVVSENAIDNEIVDELVDVTTEVTEAPEAADTTPQTTFADLGLPEGVVRKLAQNGVTTPFPIQAATIPDALAGKDILGRGRTGSGKTLSFGLPTLAQLAGGRTEKKRPRAVILTPTRELAMQVADAPPAVRRRRRPEDEGRLWRYLHGQPDLRPGARRRHPRRHPGPAARHHQPRRLLPGGRADRRPGRGRPDVRPGLPCPRSPSCSTRSRPAASACSSPRPWRTRSRPWSTAT